MFKEIKCFDYFHQHVFALGVNVFLEMDITSYLELKKNSNIHLKKKIFYVIAADFKLDISTKITYLT